MDSNLTAKSESVSDKIKQTTCSHLPQCFPHASTSTSTCYYTRVSHTTSWRHLGDMVDSLKSDSASLALLLLVLVVLIFGSLGWCMLSSCMGRDILRSLSELWDVLVISTRGDRPTSRRRPLGEEIWEMEHRRGP
ncbi:hypothetical protein BDN67DRAFT_10627 [Paxillus ammoniavirescens]|nr:hypothetical protein BDN67DRAFT_10627 [Paxillus ammoniavirescens]